MNRHRFTTTVLNPDLPVTIHTQSHQIPCQECWSVKWNTQTGRLHPWPHSLPLWNSIPTCPPITSHTQTQHLLTTSFTLAPVALTIFYQSFLFYCWRKPQCRPKASPPFPNYTLSVRPLMRISCLGKSCSVSPIIFIIIIKSPIYLYKFLH